MIIKESKEYFKIGKQQAKTITEWIKYRDSILYDQLVRIDSIDDEVFKKKLITEYLEACNYELEQYLDADVFKYFLCSFHGNDAEALTRYLRLVINFFKSYKIQLYDVNTHYVFDDKLENTIRAIDYLYTKTGYNLIEEGHNTFDFIKSITAISVIDSKFEMIIREKVLVLINEYIKLLKKDVMKTSDLISFIVTMLFKDEVFIKELFNTITELSYVEHLEDMIEDMLMELRSHIKPKDYFKIKERCITLIKDCMLLKKIDCFTLLEDLKSILSSYTTEEDISSQIIEDVKIKFIILATCANTSGIDQLQKIQSMIISYDIMKIEEKIKLMKKIYEVLSKKDQVNTIDEVSKIVSSYNPKTKIDILDHVLTILYHYLNETNTSVSKEALSLSSSLEVKDYTTILEYIQILVKQAKNLLTKDNIEVFEQIKEYISSYQYNDDMTIEDIMKQSILLNLNEDNVSIQEDYITNTIIRTLAKDIFNLQEHIQVLHQLKETKKIEEPIQALEDIGTYSKIHMKSTYHILTQIAHILSTTLLSDEASPIDNLSSLQSSISLTNHVTITDKLNDLKITNESIKKITIKDYFKIHDSLTLETID